VSYDIVLAGTSNEQLVIDEIKKYVNTVFIPSMKRTRKIVDYFKWLCSIIDNSKYDAVHIHCNSATSFVELYAAKRMNVKIRICHCHSSSCKHKMVHHFLKPFINRIATIKIACSDKAGQWLFNKHFVILQNGIAVDRFKFDEEVRNKYRNELNINNCFVCGHVGDMDVEKKHMFLLKVFAEVCKEINNAKLVLIGDGRLKTEIISLIHSLNLDTNVLVLGEKKQCGELLSSV
jgi:glycosyltransferase involved in cell wall biosynthesis